MPFRVEEDDRRSAALISLVSEFYLAALWRGADEDGLRHHVDLLANADDPLHRAATILADFRHSAEARQLRAHMAPENEGGAVETWTLGTHCYAAAALHATGLRKGSYPLDWVFSSAAMGHDCIQDGFSKFLEPAYYEQTHLLGVEHTWYRDMLGVQTVFAHRDPRNPKDHSYYRRRVERFHDRLASNIPSMAVMISSEPQRDTPCFGQIAHLLTQRSPSVAFTMIYVEPPDQSKRRSHPTSMAWFQGIS